MPRCKLEDMLRLAKAQADDYNRTKLLQAWVSRSKVILPAEVVLICNAYKDDYHKASIIEEMINKKCADNRRGVGWYLDAL